MIVNARVPHRLFLALFALSTLACARTDERVAETGVRLSYLPGCAPTRVERVLVEALGDFGLGARDVGALSFGDSAAAAQALADLPSDTQLYRLTVEQAAYRGYAIVPALSAGAHSDALLLPLATACDLAQLASFYAPGVSVARAGDSLVLSGLSDSDGVGASRAVLRAEIAVPSVTRIPAGLFVPRVLPGSVSVGDQAWFIGGAGETTLGARGLDTFERFGGATASNLGRLAAPRVAPQVAVLSDGSVLVAAGSERVGGAVLPSFERIPGPTSDSAALSSALPFTPDALAVHTRDDGIVLVLARSNDDVRVFELDVAADALVERTAPAVAPGSRLDLATSRALPGARVAAIETRAGVATGRVWLALPGGDDVLLDDFLPSFAGLTPRASAALHDARWFVVGSRNKAVDARVIDVGRRTVETRDLPFVTDQLVPRTDGSLVGVAEAGAWVLREDTLTAFDSPGGTLLADDVAVLALDADGRFVRDGLSLRASVTGARFDLAALTFEDVHVTLRASAGSELLLVRGDGKARSIQVGGAQVGPAFCQLDAMDGARVELVRRGERVDISSGDASLRCSLDGLSGPLRIAMRFAEGAAVDELLVARE